jgi:ATP-dependent Clp protease adaptor protein ClpS
MDNSNKSTTKTYTGKKEDTVRDKMNFLVLHNDDYHTFEYVIKCLIEVCGHDTVQAEQCTYVVHYKGSCDILKGKFKQLVPFYRAMTDRKLTVTIE